MRSRAARLTFVAVTWIALGTAGYFLSNFQQRISLSASAVREVDLHAREADDAIAELRIGQQAYVANGQGVGFWMPKVAATVETVNAALTALRQAAMSPEARTALEQASAAVAEFVEVDKRARDYIHAGQALMAGDVIFTEGGQLAAVAARQVETARQAEYQAHDAVEASLRKQQLTIIGAAAGLAALVTLLLGLIGPRAETGVESEPAVKTESTLGLGDDGVVSHARSTPSNAPAARAVKAPPAAAPAPAVLPTSPTQARNAVVLKTAADLATDFGRVRDSDELSRLLARAADLVDATGLIVWMTVNEDLRPVLTHGYPESVLARMPPVPRSADNAAAAAVRTGTLQIVLSKPGGAPGAIVAPILTADGCIGALSAEIKAGGEGSEAVQAVAAIVAAHLATVLAAAPAETEAAAPEPKAAAQR